MDDEGDAYIAFQEGSRLLADGNVHAAVVALERARRLEPEKGSVRETLARAYYRSGRFDARGARSSAPRSTSSRSTTTRTTASGCACSAPAIAPARGAPAARDRDAARQRRLPARARRSQ